MKAPRSTTSRRADSKPETATFPRKITIRDYPGITAKVYKQVRKKGEAEYTSYLVGYTLLGKWHLESFADLGQATAAAEEAIRKIANGEQQALQLRNGDAFEYIRGREAIAGLPGVTLDGCATIVAECLKILAGIGTPQEACREFAKRHGGTAVKALIPAAVKEMLEQEEKEQDGKRKVAWVKLLRSHLENKFAADFNRHVHSVEPADLNLWLSKLDCAERTKKNIRDCLKHFFKWCRGRGYLPKDADPLADVQDYRKRKRGKIHILTPDELSKLLSHASEDLLPYIALRAFAGLRDAEAAAIEWQHIDLKSGWIEITEEVAKSSDDDDGVRRLIPIRECLKIWLKDRAKQFGRVCPFENTTKQIVKLCGDAGVAWKRNCLRHSYISYAVAESGDIPQVAIHSGNSPAVIKQHYWNPRTRPDAAKEWFNVLPVAAVPDGKVEQMPSAVG